MRWWGKVESGVEVARDGAGFIERRLHRIYGGDQPCGRTHGRWITGRGMTVCSAGSITPIRETTVADCYRSQCIDRAVKVSARNMTKDEDGWLAVAERRSHPRTLGQLSRPSYPS